MTAEELNVIIKASGANRYQKDIMNCSNATDVFSGAVKKLAGMFSAAAIIKFGSDCVKVASDLQEVQNVVDNSFGSMSKSVSAWAEANASNFGLSELSAKQYLGYIGSMATQFGFTTQQAAEMAETLTGLTGDVASFYNLSDSESYNKLKSIFTGETESLKSIGVVMTQNALDAYAMANGFGKTTQSMTEQEKVALRYQFVLDKLANATGDFSRTSDGFANSSRSLSLELENLKAEVGEELLPAAATIISLASDGLQMISPLVRDVASGITVCVNSFESLDDETKQFATDAIRFLSPVAVVVGAMTGNFAVMGLGIAGTLGFFTRADEAIEETAGAASDLALNANAASAAVKDVGDATSSLDLFLAGFDQVTRISGNGKSNTAFSNIISDADVANARAMSDEVMDIVEGAGRFLMPDGLSFGDSWVSSFQRIGETLQEVAPNVYSFFEKVGEKVYDLNSALAASLDKKEPGIAGHVTDEGAVYDVVNSDVNTKFQTTYTTAKGHEQNYAVTTPQVSNASIYGFSSIADAIRSSKASSKPQNTTVNANLYLDGKQITTAVVNGINSITTTTGTSPLYD